MLKTRMGAVAALGIALATGPAAVVAAGIKLPPDDFKLCDGYGRPSKSDDGMTTKAYSFGPGAGDTVRSAVKFGTAGLASCDNTLTDPTFRQEQWLRRVSLLTARAGHHIASGDLAGAEADIAEAEKTARNPSEPFYQRSLAIQIELVRVAILRERGEQAGAERLALEVWKRRPFDYWTTGAVLAAAGPKASPKTRLLLLKRMAALEFGDRRRVFQELFDERRLEEASALAETLPGPGPTSNDPIYIGDHAFVDPAPYLERRARFEATAALQAGEKAYALAAMGKADRALAILADARARARAATAPLKPRLSATGRPTWDPVLPAINKANSELGSQLTALLDGWTLLVELKLGRSPSRATPWAIADLPASWPSIDMAQAQRKDEPAESLAQLAKRTDEATAARRGLESSMADLFASFPDAETAARLLDYQKPSASSAKIMGAAEAPDMLVVRVIDYQASNPMVAEAALLEAAELAKAKGWKAFAVLRRVDAEQRPMTSVGVIAQTEYGPHELYMTELLIQFVDPAKPPLELQSEAWRLFDADEVYAALTPVYGPRPKS